MKTTTETSEGGAGYLSEGVETPVRIITNTFESKNDKERQEEN